MTKRWERRRYFKFTWAVPPSGKVRLGDMALDSFPITDKPLVIYGYESDSEFNDDHGYIDECLWHGKVHGYWFSIKCVDGEWGSNPLARMTQISAEEFELAKNVGFKVDWTRAPRKEGL